MNSAETGGPERRCGGVPVWKTRTAPGGQVRWTRTDLSLGPVNSQTADVTKVREGHGDVQAGRRRNAGIERRRQPTPSYRSGMSLNRARVPGRTVDTVIEAMEAEHSRLITQKSFYVEITERGAGRNWSPTSAWNRPLAAGGI